MEELRYPFSSAVEFFAGGYAFQREAFHLDFAYCWLAVTIVATIVATKNIKYSLCILFFSLTTYNNFAFTVGGIAPNELAGLGCLLLTTFGRNDRPEVAKPFFRSAQDVLFIIFVYTALILLAWPALLASETNLFQRLLVFGKPILLFGVGSILVNNFEAIERNIYSSVVIAVFGACITYLIQVLLMLVWRTMPYGTFLGAGNFEILSFGGTSIERGHFAKFLVPFFPILLYLAQRSKGLWILVLFCIICLANFSASGYAFFFFMVLCFFIVGHRSTLSSAAYRRIAVSVLALVGILAWQFSSPLLSLAQKMYLFAVAGDETEGAGRSAGLFFDYLETYPLGIGYGGSAFRTAPGMPEINAGGFAFVTQLGLLSAPVFALWACAWISTVRQLRALAYRDPQVNVLLVGILAMPLVFFADVLWFVPSVWLCFFIGIATIHRHATVAPVFHTAIAEA